MQQVTNLQEIETAINEHGEMIVGKNKKNKVVIMSLEEYKKRLQEKEIVEHLKKSEQDIEAGRVKDASKVFEEWSEKYGI